MILGAFTIYYALTSGFKGIKASIIFALVLLISFTIAGLVYPPATELLTSRVSEFGLQGTSGNERFVTPFIAMNFVFNWEPYAFWTGIGPGSAENLVNLPDKYVLNTPVKIILEYGVFGLISYLLFICTATRSRIQRALLGPLLVMLLLAGGNQSFSPIVFPILLLINIASLDEGGRAPRHLASRVANPPA